MILAAKKKKSSRSPKSSRVVSTPSAKCSKGGMLAWGLLVVILKVVGIAFLVQGFILQLATGILYYGLLHYAIGLILVMLAWHTKASCRS
jgi:hypothetical protein